MKRALLFILLLACRVPTHAHAEFWTGEKLFQACQAQSDMALGYMMGALDAFELDRSNASLYCMPSDSVATRRIMESVCEDITHRAAGPSSPAIVVLNNALAAAFPCGKESSPQR
jgi:Rap1a immunity proteins